MYSQKPLHIQTCSVFQKGFKMDLLSMYLQNLFNDSKQRNPKHFGQHLHFLLIHPLLCDLEIVIEIDIIRCSDLFRLQNSFPSLQWFRQCRRARNGRFLREFIAEKVLLHLVIDSVHSLDSDRNFTSKFDETFDILPRELIHRLVDDLRTFSQSLLI